MFEGVIIFMGKAYIIVASQDYERANHRGLWDQLAKISQEPVVVVNIPADRVVSVLRGKKDRIVNAKKGPKAISENLTVVRPLFFLRPEITPKCGYKKLAKEFWNCIKQACPDLDTREVRVLIYNAQWAQILVNTQKNMKLGYYLFDEVRYNGHDGSIDKKRYSFDEYACKHSNVIFTMTQRLTESRQEYQNNIVTIGNGAEVPVIEGDIPERIKNSVAFIGNFRDWIDEELLEGLIKKRTDKRFVFVGPVEENMREFFIRLLNENINTFYYGLAEKADMGKIYKMFDCVLIPYKNNEFVAATRPIKIVESVLAGTPVVTIPMNGYKETPFIRFATDVESFSIQIDEVSKKTISPNDVEFKRFLEENTWEAKAKIILEQLS